MNTADRMYAALVAARDSYVAQGLENDTALNAVKAAISEYEYQQSVNDTWVTAEYAHRHVVQHVLANDARTYSYAFSLVNGPTSSAQEPADGLKDYVENRVYDALDIVDDALNSATQAHVNGGGRADAYDMPRLLIREVVSGMLDYTDWQRYVDSLRDE